MPKKKAKRRKNSPQKTNLNLRLSTYNVTEEPIEDKYTRRIPKKIVDQLQDIQDKINDKPQQMISQLIDYIDKYPNVPLFYNYLSAAYAKIGDYKNAESTVLKNLKKYPDYLFAKLNYANLCLRKGKHEKIPEIFGHKLDLKLMYPGRSTFHISEFAGFTLIMCKYYNEVGERKSAELLFKSLKQIAPNHLLTKEAKRVLYPSLIGRIFRVFKGG